MRSWISPAVFTMVFSVAYPIVFALNLPLFQFFPMTGDLRWAREAASGPGPSMAWYGLIASGGLVALVASVLLRDTSIPGRLRRGLWLFPCAAILVCVFLLRHFVV